MITNADNHVHVSRVDGRLTPFNTGKVQIGLLYQPRPPDLTESEERVQAALLGWGVASREPCLWTLVLVTAAVLLFLIFLTRWL
jgi:hypothetical protein